MSDEPKSTSSAKPRDADAPAKRPRAKTKQTKQRERLRRTLRPRPGTLLALAFAGFAVALTWADPFAQPEDGTLLVNNRSGGRRVFPSLVDADPTKATIELQAPDGPAVRMVPTSDGGHQVMHGDEVLGPMAGEDFEGVWSSLRLATAQRTATRGQGVGQRGVIRISLPDETLTLALGGTVPGGGIYGAFEVDGDTWVVETEMLTLVEQPPRSWLGKRLLPIDAGAVTNIGWADERVLSRGEDGFWRVRAGAVPALLSSDAVEFHLGRLLRAQIEPFISRAEVSSDSLRPWVVVTSEDGSSRALLVGEACPGYPRKRIVDRGAGLLGCIDEQLLEGWPLLAPRGSMIESRLVPHDYARVVGIDLELPAARSLVRRGGEWSYVDDASGGERSVAEAELRRWFGRLCELEVALLTELEAPEGSPAGEGEGSVEPLSFEPDWSLVVHADTGERVRVRCRLGGPAKQPKLCVRDEGPLLRLITEPPRELSFDAQTFARRDLSTLNPGEVRQLEILPPEQAEEQLTVRQSVHADMGAWVLDAPSHVDGDGAIDVVRLENLLWALQSLRAEAWVEPPSVTPQRRIVAEVVPERGRRFTLRLSLFPNCVVEVQGQRPAAVSEAQCAALAEDLMFDDPLRFWLERSRGVEVTIGEARTFVRRREGRFVAEDGSELDEALLEQLQSWIDWRSQGIRAGEPPGSVEGRIDVRRDFGAAAAVEIGEGWARLEGEDWYYLQREPGEDAQPIPDRAVEQPEDAPAVEAPATP